MGGVAPASPGFRMWMRWTAGARQRPDLGRSSRLDRFSSKCAPYLAAAASSTPAAPSLRVQRQASCNPIRSMGRASVFGGSLGSIGARVASFCPRVERVCRFDVQGIGPSKRCLIGSVAFGHWVAGGEFPHLDGTGNRLRLLAACDPTLHFLPLGATTVAPIVCFPPAWTAAGRPG